MQLAIWLGRILPPLAALRVRAWLMPYSTARQVEYDCKTTAVTGSLLECRLSDMHGYYFVFHGCFDWRNVAVCRAVCRPGDTIIEVGANVGTETVCFADIVGREGHVVALEPDEENFRALKRMVELNGFRHVDVVQCAAGDRDGTIQFEATPDRCMSGIGFVREAGSACGLTVEVRRLDWWHEHGCTAVAAVLIDVEGYEPAVLRGARTLVEQCRPVIVLEAAPQLLARNGWGLEDLARELARARYRFFTIGRFGLEPSNLRTRQPENWLCLPEEKLELAGKIQRTLRRAGWMPMVRGLNPLARG